MSNARAAHSPDGSRPTAASQREYATLRAMGIPKWRLKLAVLVQSFWVGLFGVALAMPLTFALAELAQENGWSAEELLRTETKRHERAWRKREKETANKR